MDQYIEFVNNNVFLFIALAAIVGLIAWTETQRLLRGYQEVAPPEAVRLINRDDALLLDVRDDRELGQGKIRGARHIPLNVLKQRLDELDKQRDKPIITYCRTGERSAQASTLLYKHAFPHVYHLKGGLTAWQNASLPTSKN